MKPIKVIHDHPFFEARRRLDLIHNVRSASFMFQFLKVQRLKRDLNERSK